MSVACHMAGIGMMLAIARLSPLPICQNTSLSGISPRVLTVTRFCVPGGRGSGEDCLPATALRCGGALPFGTDPCHSRAWHSRTALQSWSRGVGIIVHVQSWAGIIFTLS